MFDLEVQMETDMASFLQIWPQLPYNLTKNMKKMIWFRMIGKLDIFWEGHKILRNLHRRFDRYYIGQIYGEYFAKICGLLRIYKLWN